MVLWWQLPHCLMSRLIYLTHTKHLERQIEALSLPPNSKREQSARADDVLPKVKLSLSCLGLPWVCGRDEGGEREKKCLVPLWNEDKVIVMIHAVKWFVTAGMGWGWGWGGGLVVVRVSVWECYSQLLLMTANSPSYGTWALALGIFMVRTNHQPDTLFLSLWDESKLVNRMDTRRETCRLWDITEYIPIW